MQKSLEFFNEIEACLRAGMISKARLALQKFNLTNLERAQTIHFSNMARRAGLFNLSLRALKKYVRPKGRQSFKPTDDERAEYAASLIRVGAIEEALDLLTQIDPILTPQSLFYRSLGHFRLWQYQEAVPLLENYVQISEIGSYSQLLGKINLAAAYIFCGRFKQSDPLLGHLREVTLAQNFTVLYGNTLELSAQSAMGQGLYPQAEIFLKRTDCSLNTQNTTNSLYLKKWKILLDTQKKPKENHSTAFSELRKQALELKDWETLRECDLREGSLTHNIAQLQKVYYGSPFASYRDLLIEKNPWFKNEIPDFFLWSHSNSFSQKWLSSQILDLSSGEWPSSALRPGLGIHQLLMHLCKDFYRPAQMGSLFCSLTPNEFYDPDVAHNRLHNLIYRFRKWSENSSIPFDVIETQSHYSLQMNSSMAIKIPLGSSSREFLNPVSRQMSKAREASLKEEFTTKDLSKVLHLSSSKSNRLIKASLKQGFIEKTRHGNQVSYRFVK